MIENICFILIINWFFVYFALKFYCMNENKIMQQVTAIFSTFMVFFYLGVGSYFLFYSDLSYLDKSIRVIMGSTFVFYGLYRAYRAYVKIVELFFTDDKEDKWILFSPQMHPGDCSFYTVLLACTLQWICRKYMYLCKI